MNEALELADDCDMHAKHADNAIAFEALHNAAAMLRSQHAEIDRLTKDLISFNDANTEMIDIELRISAENQKLRDALINVARKAESLKRECGDDPESPQAIRNGMYMHLSYVARAALGETK